MRIVCEMKKIYTMYKYIFSKTQSFFWVFTIHNLLGGIISAIINVYLIMQIFNIIEQGLYIGKLILVLLLICMLEIFMQVLSSIYNHRYMPTQMHRLIANFHSEFMDKAVSVDLECYDNEEYYNDFIISLEKGEQCIEDSVNVLAIFINRIICIFTMFPLLYNINIFMFFATFFAVIVSTALQVKLNQYYYSRYLKMSKAIRQNSYIMTRFAFWEYAQELRLNNFPAILMEEFEKSYQDMNDCIKHNSLKIVVVTFLKSNIAYVILDFVINSILIYNLMGTNRISLAVYTTMLNAIFTIRQYLMELGDNFSRISENSVYFEKIKSFFEFENKVVDGPIEEIGDLKTIKIENISFKYPHSDNVILKNFTLEVQAGEKIAIVGLNGSGKSTLVKLLLRLYDVTSGKIYYNGKNIKEYNLERYRKNIGVVFQDYNMYALSLEENVMMDETIGNDKKIEFVLDSFNVFNQKYDIKREISTEFENDGIALSGGQAQKIALSRVLTKDFKLIILDEPTSALDPYAEEHLNKMLLEEMQDITVIFISHRLTTTTIADRIYYLEDGSVVESGSHTELLNLGGKYANLYNVQAEKYRTSK